MFGNLSYQTCSTGRFAKNGRGRGDASDYAGGFRELFEITKQLLGGATGQRGSTREHGTSTSKKSGPLPVCREKVLEPELLGGSWVTCTRLFLEKGRLVSWLG